MDKPKLTQNRIILAFAIAIIADITACVAYVVWQRKKEQAQTPPLRSVVDVHAVEVTSAPPVARLAEPPPLPAHVAIPAQPPPIETAVESRLRNLDELRQKGVISQANTTLNVSRFWPSFECGWLPLHSPVS
jgi:hypothetical protein